MLTKRMMLRAGALALALSGAACSADRAGGATGVNEAAGAAPSVPRVNSPAPAAIATPATPEAVRSGDGGTGGADGVVTVISSSTYDGHLVVLSEVTTSSGARVKRVTLDGQLQAEFSGDEASGGETADAKVFLDGQLVLNETLDLRAFMTSSAPSQNLSLPGAPTPRGPQLMAAFPCAFEIGLFGAASMGVSVAIAWFKFSPGPMSWDALKIAIGAEVAAAINLYGCLKKAW